MYTIFNKDHIKIEKSKVKSAKKSRWWHEKCASGLCHYCGGKFSFKELTMDHIVPLARGGRTKPGNIVPSCLPCNRSKGMDTPVDLILSSK